MRKSTNLQTPQHNSRRSDFCATGSSSGNYRMSFGQGRLSILDSVRRSSTTREGRRDRVANDKASHMANFTNVTSFLTENGFAVPPGLRLQCANSTKEVVATIEFILTRLELDYEFKKFDDDFLAIMKTLSYPFIINKRQLQPVGSAHNWPIIVHALSWLVNAAKYHQTLKEHPFTILPDSSEKMAKLAIFKMNMEAYKLFMAGEEDRIKANDEEFLTSGLKQIDGFGGEEISKMIELESKLKTAMDELEIENEKGRDLDLKLATMKSDHEKLVSYIEESDDFINCLEASIKTSEERDINLADKIKKSEQDLKEKKTIVTNQKHTIYDVQQKRTQLSHLQSTCSTNKSNFETIMKEMADVELELLNKKHELNSEIEEYHRLAANCKLIPQTAENANGYDYSIHLQNPESDASPSNIVDLKGRLKLISKQLKEANREANVKEMKEIETKQQYQNLLTTTKNAIIEQNSKVLRLEEELMFKQQEFRKSNQGVIQELAVTEEKIALLKSAVKSSNVEALETKVKEMRLKDRSMKEAYEERQVEVKGDLLEMTEDYLQFKHRVEIMLNSTTDRIKKWRDENLINQESLFNKKIKEMVECIKSFECLKKEVEAATEELKKYNI
ncbi:kinetochore-associated Ndc80 complex subunit ndc80 [Chamberlinius hualienensis]